MRRTLLLVALLVAGALAAPAGATSASTPRTEAFGAVDVEVVARPGRVEEAADAVRFAGGSVRHTFGDIVSARARADALEIIHASPAVMWVQPATVPISEVTSEGVAMIGADGWHGGGLTGEGTVVAVVDTGFTSAATRIADAELPAGTVVGGFCAGGPDGSGRHGTAVAEIVHDVAPDAALHLLCVATLGDLDLAVDAAIAADADVIVHSVGWFNTGRGDGTGLISPMVDRARSAGILWVNSAGNYATAHWSGVATDVDTDGIGEFSAGDERNGFTLAAGSTARVFLRWDDWPSASQDIDVRILKAGIVVAEGANRQSGILPPLEQASYTNNGFVAESLEIEIRSGLGGPISAEDFDLFVIGAQGLEHVVEGRSLNDISADPDALAVGAVCVCDGSLESFSSRGPTITGFAKPDLVGPDAVSTVTFGAVGFSGTSAAAPHVGGIAALMLEAFPETTVGGLEALLAERAIALPPEFDAADGAGLVHAGVPGVFCRGLEATHVGTEGADSDLMGTPGDDVISGLGGADIIDGLGGDDVICGGDGNDQINGGPGDDVIEGWRGHDVLVGGDGRDLLLGGLGRDEIDGGTDSDVIDGGIGDDLLFGGAGNDVLRGARDDDRLDGGAGVDQLDGGLGDDVLLGGPGRDWAVYSWAVGGVMVDLGLGSASGSAGSDSLSAIENVWGSVHGDVLVGDGLANRLLGGAGVDQLDGGLGDDVLLGGPGRDWAVYSRAVGGVMVDLGLGSASGSAGSDSLSAIENVWGSVHGDVLVGDGLANRLLGGAGVDQLDGGLGDDVLLGGPGRDWAVYSRAVGGVMVDLGLGSASGSAGSDSLSAIENVWGSVHGDVLVGDGLANRLLGGAGVDQLDGGLGDDVLLGGPGRDWAVYSRAVGGVMVDLGLGSASGSAGSDSLSAIENVWGSVHGDVLVGDGLANRLLGGAGVDQLDGGLGDDVLLGGPGDDVLQGGPGIDEGYGGPGADTCLDVEIGVC